MNLKLNPIKTVESAIFRLFKNDPKLKNYFGEKIDPIIRLSDPKFGDFQANGVLALAKSKNLNAIELANDISQKLSDEEYLGTKYFRMSVAAPGFINFSLKEDFLIKWIQSFNSIDAITKDISKYYDKKTIIVDFPSANTAKQAHIGHLRPMVIGESIARIIEFAGAKVIRDNHIGDWGTNFGTLIMIIKKELIDLKSIGTPSEALEEIDRLYKKASLIEKLTPELRDTSRNELVKLQNGDLENTQIWENIITISNQAFEELFEQLGVRIDVTLGESFYKDKVQRVYDELSDLKIAEESEGALVVWHNETKKFAKNNPRPFPFNIRKKDGASNYASTDLATLIYRIEHFRAEEIIYLTDARQKDHFEQLFLTANKWIQAKNYPKPNFKHVWWGTILGSTNKPIKTKSGGSIKLQSIIDEAIIRAKEVVSQKNPQLSENEKDSIAKAIGIGAIKYADLSSNRTLDYVFEWDRMLSFEGNTAPYLLYVFARINSIFKKSNLNKTIQDFSKLSELETKHERLLVRKLIQFSFALEQSLSDLRPHFLCTYLFELSGIFNTYYSNDKIIHENAETQLRRLTLCHRTQLILKLGLKLLGINTIEKM